jgi:hypothetical protein
MNKKLFGLFIILFMLAGTAAPAHAAGLTSAQINAIIGLLQAFGADQSVINNVQTALSGSPTGGGTAFCYNFNTDLTVGSRGVDVQALIYALRFSGINPTSRIYTRTYTVFDETTSGDVISFQAKYGIRQTGYVGPLTRAKLNELYFHCNQSTLDALKSRSDDATIQSDLSVIQTQAEIYYGGTGANSYGTAGNSCSTAVFSDATITKAIASAQATNGGTTLICNNSTTAHAVQSKMVTERTPGIADYWCTDSTGSASKSTTPLGINTVCPAAN